MSARVDTIGARIWDLLSSVPELSLNGLRGGGRSGRRISLAIHLLSLVVVAVIYVVLGRDQWFFYDEWDLLVSRNQWDLLAPHNGHLSLGLALITTLLKGVVGLHLYWPYLAITVVIHLALVHLLWRLMNKTGVHPLVSLLLSLVFAVLGPAVQNTLWAFQTGFIAPLALGIPAIMLAQRQVLGRREILGVIACLLVGISFASTALPVILVVVLIVLFRHGWKPALVVGGVIAVPYLLWRVTFVGPQPTDGFGASSVTDFLVRVPQYLATGLIDSISKSVPFAALAPVLLVLFVLWIVKDMQGGPLRELKIAHFLAIGALVFAILIAVSRVRLGVDAASDGRYVYVYAALTLPAIGLALTAIIRHTAVGLIFVAVLLVVVGLFNVVQLSTSALSQARINQFTKQSLSAVLVHAADGDYSPGIKPLPVLAPTLTLGDIEDFERRGQLSIGSYTDAVLLSAEVNMDLKSDPVSGSEVTSQCVTEGPLVLPVDGPRVVLVKADHPVTVDVTVERRGVTSSFTRIELTAGMQQLVGFDDAQITMTSQTPPVPICIGSLTG